MAYERKIKYLTFMEKGGFTQNVGFLKLEKRDEKVNLQIHVEKLKDLNPISVKVRLLSGDKTGLLGQFLVEGGRGEVFFEGLAYEDLVSGIGYDDLAEIHLDLTEERSLICIIKEKKVQDTLPMTFIQGQITGEVIEREEKETVVYRDMDGESCEEVMASSVAAIQEPLILQPKEEIIVDEEKENAFKRAEETVPRSLQRQMKSTKWKQLSEIYPHIRPFDDDREYLRMAPEDLVVLAKEYYSLSANSFLLHGFFNYEHLILSKERRQDMECYYVGVPGNFYTKEKQVAVLFGFQSFEGKKEPAESGDFGYYMIPVKI